MNHQLIHRVKIQSKKLIHCIAEIVLSRAMRIARYTPQWFFSQLHCNCAHSQPPQWSHPKKASNLHWRADLHSQHAPLLWRLFCGMADICPHSRDLGFPFKDAAHPLVRLESNGRLTRYQYYWEAILPKLDAHLHCFVKFNVSYLWFILRDEAVHSTFAKIQDWVMRIWVIWKNFQEVLPVICGLGINPRGSTIILVKWRVLQGPENLPATTSFWILHWTMNSWFVLCTEMIY